MDQMPGHVQGQGLPPQPTNAVGEERDADQASEADDSEFVYPIKLIGPLAMFIGAHARLTNGDKLNSIEALVLKFYRDADSAMEYASDGCDDPTTARILGGLLRLNAEILNVLAAAVSYHADNGTSMPWTRSTANNSAPTATVTIPDGQ